MFLVDFNMSKRATQGFSKMLTIIDESYQKLLAFIMHDPPLSMACYIWFQVGKAYNTSHNMSLSKLKSGNSDPFENGGRPSGPPAVQISCRVCHGVFFDNDSLVRHFECHTEEELRIYHKDLASLLRGYKSSLSALATMNEDHSAFSSLNDCFRPRSLPANKKPTDRNRYYIPMMNFTPSVSPSSNPQLNVSQPGRNSRRRVMRQYGVNSSFSCPSMASLLDAIKSASGSRATPQFQLREQNGGQTDLPHYQNPSISELGMPNKEKIILSDEEED